MSAMAESSMTYVTSPDGTKIAYTTSGDGPPLVMVHGTTADHNRWAPLLPYLEPHATVHAMDRRGRGASGDGPVYQLEREFEDVAAVVDAVAEASGSKVDVYGHSFGGFCAFSAATLTSNINRLVLYEGWPDPSPEEMGFPPGVGEGIDALVAKGENEAALETFAREVVQVREEELQALRAQAAWEARVAAAHTITREIRAMSAPEAALDPEKAARITVPVLLMAGENSPDPAFLSGLEPVEAALLDARLVVIEGQQHLADVMVPDLFASHLLAFLR